MAERLDARAKKSKGGDSLPTCGGGLGRGVAQARIVVKREALYSPDRCDPPSLPSPTRGEGERLQFGRRTPLAPQQGRGPFLQFLDKGVRAAAAGEDRGEFVASRREVAHRAVQIDVDHPPAANKVVDRHGPAAGLEQLGLDDFAAAARFRARLRVDDKALARIIGHLARIVGDEETSESLPNRSLLAAREAAPGGPRGQSRHRRNVEGGGNGRSEALVAFAHAELAGLSERRHQLLIIRLDVSGGRIELLRPRRGRTAPDEGHQGRNPERR